MKKSFLTLSLFIGCIVCNAQIQSISNYPPTSNQSSADLFMQGQKDASVYYRGFKGASTGTFVVSLLSPIVGLIPAMACSATPPKEISLTYPNVDLINKTDYTNDYKLKAKKIKQGRVWKNWGIALGINIVAVVLIVSEKK